ncbi:ABC transporter permease [Sinorhizobium meliloti]|uniref:ABC transporter permease n=1 Tax=Rhizobium meliloti TaxID=382 RepID=UPI003D654705
MSSRTTLHLRRSWLYAVGVIGLLFLNLPVLVIVPFSFSNSSFLEFPPKSWSLRWYEAFFSSQEWQAATSISLTAAVLTTLLALPLGTAAAYGLHKSNSKWATVLNGYIVSPSVVPVIIIAVGVYFLLAAVRLNNTIVGLVLAHSVLAIPFVVIAVAAGLKNFDFTLEKAARSLGAGATSTFFKITLPNIKRSLVTGGVLAFLTSLDEVVVALFISSGPNSTLPRRMFASMRDQVDPTIAAISTLLIVLVVIVLCLSTLMGSGWAQDEID